ncbi:hypothetical protein Tco_0221549 [Tanacetum coccineum]
MRLPQFTKGSKREGFYQSKGGKDNSSSQVHNGREKDVILIGKVKQKITRGLERAQGIGEFVLYLLSKEAQSRMTYECHRLIGAWEALKGLEVFEVNYDGVFFELPLRYEYGKVLSLKLSNSNRMSYSEMLDMLVYKLESEIRAPSSCSIPLARLLITREEMRILALEIIFSFPCELWTSPRVLSDLDNGNPTLIELLYFSVHDVYRFFYKVQFVVELNLFEWSD